MVLIFTLSAQPAEQSNGISKAIGRKVVFDKNFEHINHGDVPATYASTDLLQEAVGFKPD